MGRGAGLGGDGGQAGVAATVGGGGDASRDGGAALAVPRFKVGWRRFSFVQIGAVDAERGGTSASRGWNNVVLDAYPVSSLVRIGLSTQFGWAGSGPTSGDYLAAESVTIGVQRRGAITPFVEGLAGVGYMRRLQFGMTVPTAYWQMGVDAGAEFAVSGRFLVSAAIGWLRPVNGFLIGDDKDSFTSVYWDTWSLKLAVGI